MDGFIWFCQLLEIKPIWLIILMLLLVVSCLFPYELVYKIEKGKDCDKIYKYKR